MKYKCVRHGVLLNTPEERKNHAEFRNEIPIPWYKPSRKRSLRAQELVERETLSRDHKELAKGLSVAYKETAPDESV